ncbi:MAG: C40 family peptidase [Muribaculaceae bacterium]|nr:C40 family peptidase [Muribaculaceae bacterium]
MKKILLTLTIMAVALGAAAATMSSVQSTLDKVKKRLVPDTRTTLWDVTTSHQGGKILVKGVVGNSDLKNELEKAFKKEQRVQVEVNVAETFQPMSKRWALVKLAIATLRCEPKHSAEVATQAIMGTPVKVLDNDGDWYRIQMPDKYIAWVPESSLFFRDEDQMKEWRTTERYIVTAYDSRLVTTPGGDETVSDLVLGCILEYRGEQDGWIHLVTPDGRDGWVEDNVMANFATWRKRPLDIDLVERTARRMMGSGYLWGGTTTKVTDCSGLMKISYFASGIILQRDASQQALTGKKIEDWHNCELGDLLFFGNSKTGRVTHVGMYLRDGKYIHCSGQVKINSLEPGASDYLYSPLSISRVKGEEETPGITSAARHPWY